MPGWWRLTYGIVYALVRVAIWLLTRTTVRGAEHVPPGGAAIVVSNHIHAIDPALVVGAVRRPVVMMAKAEGRRGIMKLFMAMSGTVTVRRGAVDRQALQHAAEVLRAGQLLGIFPEGTRSHDGALGEARGGAAMLALQAGVPIIPVAITGTPSVFHHGFPWVSLPRGQVVVTIGEPFRLEPVAGETRHDERRRLSETMMRRIAALLPPEQRGRYADPPPEPALTGGMPLAVIARNEPDAVNQSEVDRVLSNRQPPAGSGT